jgi:hypothetical protein
VDETVVFRIVGPYRHDESTLAHLRTRIVVSHLVQCTDQRAHVGAYARARGRRDGPRDRRSAKADAETDRSTHACALQGATIASLAPGDLSSSPTSRKAIVVPGRTVEKSTCNDPRNAGLHELPNRRIGMVFILEPAGDDGGCRAFHGASFRAVDNTQTLDATGDQQYQQDENDEAQTTARVVAPGTAVRPRRQRAYQQ